MEPNLLAHFGLVTTDASLACFVFGAIYFLWRTCRRGSAGNAAGFMAFFVLAILTKFSGLLLVPLVAFAENRSVLSALRLATKRWTL